MLCDQNLPSTRRALSRRMHLLIHQRICSGNSVMQLPSPLKKIIKEYLVRCDVSKVLPDFQFALICINENGLWKTLVDLIPKSGINLAPNFRSPALWSGAPLVGVLRGFFASGILPGACTVRCIYNCLTRSAGLGSWAARSLIINLVFIPFLCFCLRQHFHLQPSVPRLCGQSFLASELMCSSNWNLTFQLTPVIPGPRHWKSASHVWKVLTISWGVSFLLIL